MAKSFASFFSQFIISDKKIFTFSLLLAQHSKIERMKLYENCFAVVYSQYSEDKSYTTF